MEPLAQILSRPSGIWTHRSMIKSNLAGVVVPYGRDKLCAFAPLRANIWRGGGVTRNNFFSTKSIITWGKFPILAPKLLGVMPKEEEAAEFEQVIERGCGIFIHKKTIIAIICGKGIRLETREYDGCTESLDKLGDWLKYNKITHVAIETTGICWKSVFYTLEGDFEICLVNASHLKSILGDNTVRKDSKRLCKILLAGLLRGEFIPVKPNPDLRDLTQYRKELVEKKASEKDQVYKYLEEANIKLSSVVSNLSGDTANKIIDAIIDGQEYVDELVKLHHRKMKVSVKELASALTGKLTDHHRYMLKIIKQSMQNKEAMIKDLDIEIEKLLKENEMELDSHLLSAISGVDKDSSGCIKSILAKIDNDMS